MATVGWTPQSWESAMTSILETAAKKKRKYGQGQGAPDNDPDQPDTDAKAPPASHRTCKGCGAHMATDAGTCPSCGAKWSSG